MRLGAGAGAYSWCPGGSSATGLYSSESTGRRSGRRYGPEDRARVVLADGGTHDPLGSFGLDHTNADRVGWLAKSFYFFSFLPHFRARASIRAFAIASEVTKQPNGTRRASMGQPRTRHGALFDRMPDCHDECPRTARLGGAVREVLGSCTYSEVSTENLAVSGSSFRWGRGNSGENGSDGARRGWRRRPDVFCGGGAIVG